MGSKETIRTFIETNFTTWTKEHFPEETSFYDSDLYKIDNGEFVVFSYLNDNITGSDRGKPQIRVFVNKAKDSFEFAKRNNYRFFLFTIFTHDNNMASGLTNFQPRNFIVSLETNLDNDNSRRDLRSLYDYVQENLNGNDFIRCPKGSHNAGINQASFINIGDENHRIKEIFKNYVTYFDNRPYMESKESRLKVEKLVSTESYKNSYSQIILYGVPGSGKSYTIKSILSEKSISSENTMRVVFHPEYTNSDFIGQILPRLKKDDNGDNLIDYQFTAGPFTKILREAYCNPTTNYALVIEEINRGNAAAIFGELFQLLDRLDEDCTESYNGVTYTKGWSAYGVHNDCINSFICGLYDEEGENPKEPCIHFDSNSAIRLPSNLSLFATMNTSDQNVFSLDNAFKRRWDLKLIPNKFVFDSADTKENQKQLAQCFANIEGFDFTWGAFVNAINRKIINEQSGDDISSFEDKQIGMWFVKAISKDGVEGKIITKETFLHKVIEYLFDDVFKLEPTQVFTKLSLAELIEIAEGNPRAIFVNGIIASIESEQLVLDAQKGTAKLG